MNIYVGKLSYDLTEDELRAAFAAHGEIESVNIIKDRDTGRSKGFGFVEMPQKSQGLAAIEALNETDLGGSTITVNEARPKSPRRGGGGGGGGGRGGGGYGGGGGRNRY